MSATDSYGTTDMIDTFRGSSPISQEMLTVYCIHTRWTTIVLKMDFASRAASDQILIGQWLKFNEFL